MSSLACDAGEGPLPCTCPSREDAVIALRTVLRYIGDDPNRLGLLETPDRVLRAWEQSWGLGYNDPPPKLSMFPEQGIDYNQMVLVKDISFFSTCEHHMAPFYGVAHIAYLPDAERGVLGLSKFARVVEHFARRLQVQERLTAQIANYLSEKVSPHVGVVMRATHLCMVSRGVRQLGALTVTSSLRGDFLNDSSTKAEFLRLTQG